MGDNLLLFGLVVLGLLLLTLGFKIIKLFVGGFLRILFALLLLGGLIWLGYTFIGK
jgi:hypothetical protein